MTSPERIGQSGMARMTRKGALEFLSYLKKGKTFASRFQEQEWGLFYLPETGTFKEWGRELDYGTGDGRNFDEELTEEQLILKLMKSYNLERMKQGLRDS